MPKTNTVIKHADLSSVIDVILYTRSPRANILKNYKGQSKFCYACGHKDGFKFLNIINDELSDTWGLSKNMRKSFDIRESLKCLNCGSSLRSNLHARTICKIYAKHTSCLKEAVKDKDFRSLKIAEINANGALHPILSDHPNLSYSEYKPTDKNIRHENLDKLTYETDFYDLVLTSETLEHVPDWKLALTEVRRILKPGGRHIFTTPTILSRQIRTRAIRKDGKIKRLLPDSYHGYNRGNPDDYLVFSEFGADVRKQIDNIGFETFLYYRNILRLSDPNFVFVSTKV